jgi:protein-tyrosine-phosphatase
MLTKPREKKVIVFLCTGDTCRGPMAQGYMKAKLDERAIAHVEVRTAGVMTIAGLVPTPEAKQVMDKEGIDIGKHRSAPFTPELLRRSDLVLGMTPFHVQHALRMAPEAKGKTHLLKEFAKSDMKNYQVTDPMGATLEVYKRVYREIKLAIDRLLEEEFVIAPPTEDVTIPRPRPAAPTPAPAPVVEKAAPAAPAKASSNGSAADAKAPAKKAAPAKKPAAKAAPAKAKPAPAKKAAAPKAKPAAKKVLKPVAKAKVKKK